MSGGVAALITTAEGLATSFGGQIIHCLHYNCSINELNIVFALKINRLNYIFLKAADIEVFKIIKFFLFFFLNICIQFLKIFIMENLKRKFKCPPKNPMLIEKQERRKI